LDEVETSILKTGHAGRYRRSLSWLLRLPQAPRAAGYRVAI
jgi:hypothetical protein